MQVPGLWHQRLWVTRSEISSCKGLHGDLCLGSSHVSPVNADIERKREGPMPLRMEFAHWYLDQVSRTLARIWTMLRFPYVIVRVLWRNTANRINVSVLKEDSLGWIIKYGLCSTTMTASHRWAWEVNSCLVHESGCLPATVCLWILKNGRCL